MLVTGSHRVEPINMADLACLVVVNVPAVEQQPEPIIEPIGVDEVTRTVKLVQHFVPLVRQQLCCRYILCTFTRKRKRRGLQNAMTSSEERASAKATGYRTESSLTGCVTPLKRADEQILGRREV